MDGVSGKRMKEQHRFWDDNIPTHHRLHTLRVGGWRGRSSYPFCLPISRFHCWRDGTFHGQLQQVLEEVVLAQGIFGCWLIRRSRIGFQQKCQGVSGDWRSNEGNNLEEKEKMKKKYASGKTCNCQIIPSKRKRFRNILRALSQDGETEFRSKKVSLQKLTHILWSTMKIQSYLSWQEVEWLYCLVCSKIVHSCWAYCPKVQWFRASTARADSHRQDVSVRDLAWNGSQYPSTFLNMIDIYNSGDSGEWWWGRGRGGG